VGSFVCQFLKLSGYFVGSTSSLKSKEICARLGVDVWADHSSISWIQDLAEYQWNAIVDASPSGYLRDDEIARNGLTVPSYNGKSFLDLISASGVYFTFSGGLVRTMDRYGTLIGLATAMASLKKTQRLLKQERDADYQWLLYKDNPQGLRKISQFIQQKLIQLPEFQTFQYPHELDLALLNAEKGSRHKSVLRVHGTHQ